jgi:hypothetical protein
MFRAKLSSKLDGLGYIISQLLLEGLDAVLTLCHLEQGGSEANPLMALMLTVALPRKYSSSS